jgi:threonine dehydrogenase-like Zn-dependent dehydrogenase
MGILNADGCFAEYLAVPATNLHLVPDIVEDEAAVFSEPLAAAFEILEQVHIQPTADIVVFGDGKLGLLCAQVLYLTGVRVRIRGKSFCFPCPSVVRMVQGTRTKVRLQIAQVAVRAFMAL